MGDLQAGSACKPQPTAHASAGATLAAGMPSTGCLHPSPPSPPLVPAPIHLQQRASAHGAGLQGDVECGIQQAPAARRRRRLPDAEQLGVGGGVPAGLSAVVRRCQHGAGRRDQNSAHGHLARLKGQRRLRQCQPHVALIVRGVGRLRCGGCASGGRGVGIPAGHSAGLLGSCCCCCC